MFRAPGIRLGPYEIKIHSTLRVTTAMAGGVTTRLYDVADLIALQVESESRKCRVADSPFVSSSRPLEAPMKRLVPHLVVAVLFFGVGWLAAASQGLQGSGVFRLSIDAPTGDTTIKCEGCQFLTWTADGRAGEPQPAFSFTCKTGPCWKVVGAVAVTPKPKLMAQSRFDVSRTAIGGDVDASRGR
jgi:hypothetical protein